MNAGLPDQLVYESYFNKARPHPKWAKDLPQYMWDELNKMEPDPAFRYWFFTFEDNPTMTDEQIDDLWGAHPEGSFEFNSKILAKRGYSEGLIYARLVSIAEEIPLNEISSLPVDRVFIGVDIGKTAKTVFTMVGVDGEGKNAYVIDTLEVVAENEDDHLDISRQLDGFITKHYGNFGHALSKIIIDRSETFFIAHYRNNSLFKDSKIAILASDSKPGSILERITLKEQLLHQGRLKFTALPGSGKSANMLSRVRRDPKSHGHIDNNTIEIDYSDSLDYALEGYSFRLIIAEVDKNPV